MLYHELPDQTGHFGKYGGRYVPETLMAPLQALDKAYDDAKKSKEFWNELAGYLENYVGRPTPLYFAERFSDHLGGPKIYLKREDLCHTGAHKINNCIGQILLALRMGKTRIIAETGAGQHGVATATAAALFGLPCVVYMGAEDIKRQAPNVQRMKLLGTKIESVKSGSQTLKDATNEALRDWMANPNDTFYVIGSTIGPHPYPMMVRDFQSVIGKEAKGQIMRMENRLPDLLIACVGGGSNSMGLFFPFLDDPEVKIIGVEAAGKGLATKEHSASIEKGEDGILHGTLTKILQSPTGQIDPTHSVSAGLDYPGVGPEHSNLHDTGRVQYVGVTDEEALEAFHLLSRLEGIVPALESSHALAYAKKIAPTMDRSQIVVISLSGRGDKDVSIVNSFKH